RWVRAAANPDGSSVVDDPTAEDVEPAPRTVDVAPRATVVLDAEVPPAGTAVAPGTARGEVVGDDATATVVAEGGGGWGSAGVQIAAAAALPRGGGSEGLPAPSGCQRHPSTTSALTRDPPGPLFAYDHWPPVPWKYDQYAYLLPCVSPQPSAGIPSIAQSRPDDPNRGAGVPSWRARSASTAAPLSREPTATQVEVVDATPSKSTTIATCNCPAAQARPTSSDGTGPPTISAATPTMRPAAMRARTRITVIAAARRRRVRTRSPQAGSPPL